MVNLEEIRRIAEQVRTWAESIATPWQVSTNLMGLCARSAARLYTLLTKANFPAKLYSNERHCFVCVDNVVIDVTATQFNIKDKVLLEDYTRLCQLNNSNSIYWYKGVEHINGDSLNLHQVVTGWPQEQIAIPEDYNV